MNKVIATFLLIATLATIKGKIIDNELVAKLTRNYNLNNNLNRVSSELEKNQEASPSKSVAGLMQTVLCRHFPTIPCKLIMEDKTLRTLIERTVKQIKNKGRSMNTKGINEGHRKIYDRDNYGSDGQINDEDLSNFLAVKHTGFFVEPDKQKAFRKKKKHNNKEQQNKRRTKTYDEIIEKYGINEFNKENYLQGNRPSESLEAIAALEYGKVYADTPQDWKQDTGRRDLNWNYQDANKRKTEDLKDKRTMKSYRKDVLRPDLYIKKKFAARTNNNMNTNNKSFAFADSPED